MTEAVMAAARPVGAGRRGACATIARRERGGR